MLPVGMSGIDSECQLLGRKKGKKKHIVGFGLFMRFVDNKTIIE